jgi:Trm5-related predicted tRNA methylase
METNDDVKAEKASEAAESSSLLSLPSGAQLKTQAEARLALHAAGHSVSEIADADVQNVGKRARKRLERIQRQKDKKMEKKAVKREERRKQLEADPSSLHPRSRPSELDPEVAEAHRLRNQQRKAESRKQFFEDAAAGPTVVIDMSEPWELAMTVQERSSLAQQCMFSYGSNKRTVKPARLLVTGLPQGGIVDRALHKHCRVDGWLAFEFSHKPLEEHLPSLRASGSGLPSPAQTTTMTTTSSSFSSPDTTATATLVASEESLAELEEGSGGGSSSSSAATEPRVEEDGVVGSAEASTAATTTAVPTPSSIISKPAEVVYLTADTEDELDEVPWDGSVVYVLGAIVDRNRMTRATAIKAKQLGVRAVKLPVERYCPNMAATKVLTVNHCVELLQRRGAGESWASAFARTLPERKEAKGKEAKVVPNATDAATAARAAAGGGDGAAAATAAAAAAVGDYAGASTSPAAGAIAAVKSTDDSEGSSSIEPKQAVEAEVEPQLTGEAVKGAAASRSNPKKRPLLPDSSITGETGMVGRRQRVFIDDEGADPTFRRDMRYL